MRGGVCLGLGMPEGFAQLPVPSDVLVATGAGIVATPVINGNMMTIHQLTDKAILDWKSFDIGKDNTVKFDQPGVTSVALNRIHQSDPSQILGKLTANGQIYLVNQNGFLFGKDSQINVNSLVATSLNISEQSFQLGLSQVFDQSKEAALSAVDGNGNAVKQLYLKDATGTPVLDQSGNKVKVQIYVEQGAKISANARDGRIILAAPSITNEGDIEAADGQVILAASQDKVYLQQANADSNIRGLLVEVGTGGNVNNVGKILADRGNASLIGFAVNQDGVVSASTSVKLNGSVRLMAREGIQNPLATSGALLGASTQRRQAQDDGLGTSASISLGKNSTTSVELSKDKNETAVDAQAQAHSQLEISGHQIRLGSNSVIRAKSGNVKVEAIDDPTNPDVKGNARVFVDQGANVDVSGVKNVVLPMSRNVITVELRSNELRDAPLQRDGLLHGKKVNIDLRQVGKDGHIPIADVSGALARIARNIDERSTSGGHLVLQSSGDVITKAGSVVDFSGGSVRYQGGVVNTTLLTSNNQIYDISTADPNRLYDGIFGTFSQKSPKWGLTYHWSLNGINPNRYESGYVDGKDGGTVDINAFEAELDGILKGQTITGSHQRDPSQQAQGSTFNLDLNRQSQLSRQSIVFEKGHTADIGFGDAIARKGDGSSDAQDLFLDPNLFKSSGISHASIKTNGQINLGTGAQLEMPKNGSLDLRSSGFDIEGTIIAASAEVSLRPATYRVDTRQEMLPTAITLGEKGKILVGGEWTNDIVHSANKSPVALSGGHVTLVTEQGDLRLESGSRIDASGGAWLEGNGKIVQGDAGSISLTAATNQFGMAPANLFMGGSLSAWGIQQGGTLSIATNEVMLGRPSELPPDPLYPDRTPLILDPEFFSQGGFQNYKLTSNYAGLTVQDGTIIRPIQKNLQLNADASSRHSASNIFGVSQQTLLDLATRGPANLSLNVVQTLDQRRDANLRIGTNAELVTDPGGKISLGSDTSILVDGLLKAPAGSIALTINTPSRVDKGFFKSQGIWLGDHAQLIANGLFRPQIDPSGLVNGNVLAGGSVTLNANRGYVATQESSVIDVSGATATVQIRQPGSSSSSATATPLEVASAGGQVMIRAGEGGVVDGQIRANGGSESVSGGGLTVELNSIIRNKPSESIANGAFPDDGNTQAPRTIVLSSASDNFLPSDFTLGQGLSSSIYSGNVFLSAPKLNAAGLGTITLKTDAFVNTDYVGKIEFRGDVQLNAGRQITLDSPTMDWSSSASGADHQVSLNAPFLAIGSTQSRIDPPTSSVGISAKLAPDAVAGNGIFKASANSIDLVGGLSFSGFSDVNLSSKGDIRTIGIRTRSDSKDFLGQLNVAGNLTLEGQQVYPATLSNYNINTTGSGSKISILGTATTPPAMPLSAGGKLILTADDIQQNGILRAPFGQIDLEAKDTLSLVAGSVTSVSGLGLTVPFGRGSGGLNWLFPLDSSGVNNLVVTAPEEKIVTLNGGAVDLQKGAKVDLSGGGDLHAFEFITGPGGSYDVLDPKSPNAKTEYAILPGLYSPTTPYDPSEFGGSKLTVGDSVYLKHAPGLAEGWYTLLPAHYALLPGAYLVSPEKNTLDFSPSNSYQKLDGSTVVAGRYGVAGTNFVDPRWQGFSVEPGTAARTRSQFKDYSADQFFSQQAAKNGLPSPRLPRDAGTLAITAGAGLTLGAELLANAAANGRGGQVDISADQLAILSSSTNPLSLAPGVVGILDEDLNKLKVESLLLGGVRSQESAGRRLQVVSNNVELESGAHLTGTEILLAAKDNVKLAAGSTLESQGKLTTTTDQLLVSDRVSKGQAASSDAALIRVSALKQADILRDQKVTGLNGVLTVDAGASLLSGQSMVLDSSRDTLFAGKIGMNGGSLALSSSRISLGDAPSSASGLVLKDLGFNVDELKLSGTFGIDLYGGLNFTTKNLLLDTPSLNGVNTQGTLTTLNADSVRVSNHGNVPTVNKGGDGQLNIAANTIELGEGNYSINGFHDINLTATNALMGRSDSATGSGHLKVNGNLNISAGVVSGNQGATTSIDASGYQLKVSGTSQSATPTNDGLGVAWSMLANSITSSGRYDLKSGALNLRALTGDLTLSEGSLVDVSGQAIAFNGLTRYTSAGSIDLSSDQGQVQLQKGANLNLSGAVIPNNDKNTSSHAGQLTIAASSGAFDWSGNILAGATGGAAGGSFNLDVGSLGSSGLNILSQRLGAAGFNEQISLTQEQGDLHLDSGQTLKAHLLEVVALKGSVGIDGTLDASGGTAGSITLQGSKGISLGEGALLDAHARDAGKKGGLVFLDTLNPSPNSNESGQLDLSHHSTINVSGGTSGGGGFVHLRTGRDDASGAIDVTAIDSQIIGSHRAVLEATRIYQNVSVIDANQIAAFKADTDAFMLKAQAPTDLSGAHIELNPGLDMRSSGDLTLASTWDFMGGSFTKENAAWRWEGRPGFLTLNAGGNLNINASITDAFKLAALPDHGAGGLNNIFFQDTLQPGNSWSFSLSAGKDIRLANKGPTPDPLDPSKIVQQQVMVRTGTGSIDMKAGNDLLFTPDTNQSSASAAVYTIGKPAEYTFDDLLKGQIPGLNPILPGQSLPDYLAQQDPSVLASLLRWGTFGAYNVGYEFLAEYPTGGGDIHLTAKHDIQGIQTGQMTSDWLVRSGTAGDGSSAGSLRPTAWGINVSGTAADQVVTGKDATGKPVVINQKQRRFFNQNVGALGGGDVSITAGHEVRDLSVMIPTTGKPMGVVSNSQNNGTGSSSVWLATGTQIRGGGNLKVKAAGDIVGGDFFTGLGQGLLASGGGIIAGKNGLGALIGLGQSQFDLSARRSVVLGTAFNPTLLPQQTIPDLATRKDSYFFTYGEESGLHLQATSGDVILQNDVETLKNIMGYKSSDGTGFEWAIYPGTLTALAPVGDIKINQSLNLYPSKEGQLELLAGNNIGSNSRQGGVLKLNMSDADPFFLPQVSHPEVTLLGDLTRKDYKTRERLDPESPVAAVIHAASPLHLNDPQGVSIQAKNGDIAFVNGAQLKLFLPTSAAINAGHDIRNLSIYSQNLSDAAVTRLQAGRDVIFDSRLDDNGGVVPLDQRIQVDGPGRLEVIAGRDINLGSSAGILSRGNLFNRALQGSNGASIDVLAGISGKIDYQSFIDQYMKPGGMALEGVVIPGGLDTAALQKLSPDDRANYLNGLPEPIKLGVVESVLFNQIKESAAKAAAAPESQRTALYKAGFDAIKALYPDATYKGDLALVFSQIKTLSGGDINLSAPGGTIDVGLAGTVAGIRKGADELGVVIQQAGSVNALVLNDFNVNQSRVFTMGGGDINIWSSKGNIDAGKGAKSAISAPPPSTGVDENGNIITIFPPIVSGSGIQAITPTNLDAKQGNVYLAAPSGVVNGGEAGISGGRVIIAATAVIGASNIQASGGTVGVPTAVAPPVMPSGVSGAAAGVAKAATESSADQSAANEAQANLANNTILNADVISYGQCSVQDVISAKEGCGG